MPDDLHHHLEEFFDGRGPNPLKIKVIPPDFIENCTRIVRELAKSDPAPVCDREVKVCFSCEAESDYWLDGLQHKPDCLWLQAREAVGTDD